VYLRDQKERIVVFPDVAVGDTIVPRSRKTTVRGYFPGYFFEAPRFSRDTLFGDSTINIVAPKNVSLKVALLGEGLADHAVDQAGAIRHTITYHALPRSRSEVGATSPPDRDPRILISTFRDYEELAQKFWDGARPQGQVIPEVAALADISAIRSAFHCVCAPPPSSASRIPNGSPRSR
jgi:Domain of Unknown Function with PDB structure (DUF3857)